jgi:hypothetical protein
MIASVLEAVLGTWIFIIFAVLALELVWGVGFSLLMMALYALVMVLYVVTVGLSLLWDFPAAVVKAIRKRPDDSFFLVMGFVMDAWDPLLKWMGRFTPHRPREVSLDELFEVQQFLALSPTGFEIAVGDLLTARGYRNVSLTGGAGDLAVDLTATSPRGRSVAVQCKRYAPQIKIGSPEIQKFIGMTTTHHKVDEAIFVTTSTFTRPAAQLASQHKIELIDGQRLAEMLLELRSGSVSEEEQMLAELEGRPVA